MSIFILKEAYIVSLGLYVRLFASLFVARTDCEKIEVEVSHEFKGLFLTALIRLSLII